MKALRVVLTIFSALFVLSAIAAGHRGFEAMEYAGNAMNEVYAAVFILIGNVSVIGAGVFGALAALLPVKEEPGNLPSADDIAKARKTGPAA